MSDYAVPNNYELVLSPATRGLLQCARAHDAFYDLLMGFPPVAGVLNRVALCLGDEIQAREAATPFVAHVWAQGIQPLKAAQRKLGNNTYEYMIAGLVQALSPLDTALKLSVSTAQSSHPWQPEVTQDWQAWRADNPGALQVSYGRTIDAQQRDTMRIALQRWALGSIFIEAMDVTAKWPNVAVCG